MPRQARLDIPGILHHVIIRGIERRRIVMIAKIATGLRLGWGNWLQRPGPLYMHEP